MSLTFHHIDKAIMLILVSVLRKVLTVVIAVHAIHLLQLKHASCNIKQDTDMCLVAKLAKVHFN